MQYVINNDELLHYGVLGMKWGVRNDETRRKYASGSRKTSSRRLPGRGQNEPRSSDTGLRLTDRQKKYIKRGVIAAGVALAVVGGVALYKSGALNRIGGGIAPFVTSAKSQSDTILNDSVTKLPLKNKVFTAEQDLSEVNPLRPKLAFIKDVPIKSITKGAPGRHMNCTNCSAAYVLRRKGFDVRASELGIGRGLEEIEDLYVGSRKFTELAKSPNLKDSKAFAEALDREVKAMGDGAMGHICGFRSVDLGNGNSIPLGGHDIIFENVKGKTIIRDAQINKTYTNLEAALLSYSDVHILRCDDLDIVPDKMRQVATPSSESVVKTVLSNLKTDPFTQIDTIQRGVSAAGKIGTAAVIGKKAKEEYDARKEYYNRKASRGKG